MGGFLQGKTFCHVGLELALCICASVCMWVYTCIEVECGSYMYAYRDVFEVCDVGLLRPLLHRQLQMSGYACWHLNR